MSKPELQNDRCISAILQAALVWNETVGPTNHFNMTPLSSLPCPGQCRQHEIGWTKLVVSTSFNTFQKHPNTFYSQLAARITVIIVITWKTSHQLCEVGLSQIHDCRWARRLWIAKVPKPNSDEQSRSAASCSNAAPYRGWTFNHPTIKKTWATSPYR